MTVVLRSRPAVRNHPRRTNHSQAIQTGRLNTAAQTAMATGPSSPATTVACTVSAPNPTAVAQAARR